jgi:integrase
MATWIKTSFRGVRYREHETRKHGVKFDRYFSIRYKLNGKGKEEGLGWASEGMTADDAYEELKLIKANIKRAQGPQSLAEKREDLLEQKEAEKEAAERAEKEAITFGKFFSDSYLPQAKQDKKETSVGRENGLFNVWIKPVIGDIPLKDVTPLRLEKIKRDMKAGELSDRSIEYALSVVRQVFNTAKRLKAFTGENPTNDVKFPKPDNGRMRFLTKKEAEALLNYLRLHSPDVHDITLLSLHCGLRFGEIAALTWQDVDTKKGVLTIRDAKAGSRYAFMTDQATAIMKARQENKSKKSKPSDYIFQSRKDKKLKQISLTFAKAVDALKFNEGIDDPRLQIVFHSCRHSYASWLIEQNQDLYTVQKLLGHKTNVMTQRYAHLTENKLKDAAKALSKALKTKPAGQVIRLKKKAG